MEIWYLRVLSPVSVLMEIRSENNNNNNNNNYNNSNDNVHIVAIDFCLSVPYCFNLPSENIA